MKSLFVYFLTTLTFLMVLQITSCVHEPVILEPVVEPGDTTGTSGPTDTVTNPTDTTVMGNPCDPDTIYFSRDILPVLISNCAIDNCHDQTTGRRGIRLNTYTNILASDIIDIEDPEKSDILEAITDTDPDKKMPPPPRTSLDSSQIAMIERWISQGAKELSCSESTGCDTSEVSFAATVAPILNSTCTGCHGGTSPSAGINLTSHSGVATVANNGRLYGAISHSAGFEPMPRGGDKLSDCQIVQIKSWIDDGAPNN